jgi:hypothetical protein
MQQLHNCADAYPLRTIAPAALGTSVTINGTPHDLTPGQKDLATNLAKDLQIDSTQAAKIVLQQSRLGKGLYGGTNRLASRGPLVVEYHSQWV